MQSFLPDDAGFEEAAKVWNGDIRKRPSVVHEPRNAMEVAQVLSDIMNDGDDDDDEDDDDEDEEKTTATAVSVKGGGHNVAGSAIGANQPMISLRLLNGVSWHDAENCAGCDDAACEDGDGDDDCGGPYCDVGGGCLASDVVGGSPAGNHVTVGLISTTGIGGLTLGGGVGWMSRRFGLAADSLLQVDIVTPSHGLLRNVSPVNHPDLFWAIRGGGGNFGIVTRFRFRTHPVPAVVLGVFVFERPAQFAHILRKYQQLCTDDVAAPPRDISVYAFLERDRLVLMAVHVASDVGAALQRHRQLTEPITRWDKDVTSFTEMKPLAELNSQFDSGNAAGKCYYWRSNVLDELPVDTLVELIADAPDGASIEIMHWRGAIAAVPSDATAFPHRSASFEAHALCAWPADANEEIRDRLVGWARRFRVSERNFVNIVCEDAQGGPAAAARRSFGANLERLRQVKRRYDPGNVLRFNHNIV